MLRIKEISETSEVGFRFQTPYNWEDGDHTNTVSISLFGRSTWIELPPIIKPIKRWKSYTNPKFPNMKGYWQYFQRVYGIYTFDTNLFIAYGAYYHDSDDGTSKLKIIDIPWKTSNRVLYHFLNLDRSLFMDTSDDPKTDKIQFDLIHKARSMVPKVKFKFNDYDGQEIVATCYIVRMRWEYGKGIFKWVKYFKPAIDNTILEIEFSDGIGRNKDEWKGGTVAHSIVMNENESPLDAFKRYGESYDSYKYHGTQKRGFTNIIQLEEE